MKTLKTIAMKFKLSIIMLAGFLGCLGTVTAAQDSKGTDFWLMFNDNLGSPALTIFVTSDVNTSGTISGPTFASIPFTVTANTVTPVTVPSALAFHTNDVVDQNGIHVTALQEVTVYGLNYITYTTDAYLGLPTDVLGTDYIVMSYTNSNIVNGNEFGIVGTVNGTTVTITPAQTTMGHTAGVPYTITLNQGDSYELVQTDGTGDLTGTLISSTQPVGVFGASQCSNIPSGYAYCDHICEMLAPTTTWGKKFVTVPLKSRTNGDTWRILASENGTVVTIDGTVQPAINKGQFIETILTTQSIIESDKPILVAQFSNGSTFSSNPGDPFMMMIPPYEQFLPNYTLTTVSGYVAHYINVVAPNAVVGTLTLDGVAVPAASFTAIGASGFSGAQLDVLDGSHTLNAGLPFGAFMYGFNQDDSYGYPGGQSFAPIATVTNLVLTPHTGTAPVTNNRCWDALVTDQFNMPVVGVLVYFDITGPNSGSSGFANTDVNGIAHFCFTGVNVGQDAIHAHVGSIGDNATFDWTPPCTNPTCTVSATPCNNTYTGGVPTNIYIGYGPQCATLNVNVVGGVANAWVWTGSYLNCNNCAHPVFTPTAPGIYTLSVTAYTALGCSTSCSITFCVIDVRVPGQPGKVYLCHVPPGNANNPQGLSISVNAVPAHLSSHTGDRLGRCGQTCRPGERNSNPGEMLISDESSNLEVLVYPNPFSNGFHIKFENLSDAKVSVRLFNMAGQTIQVLNDQLPDHELSLGSDLSPGIYFLEIRQGDFSKVVKVNKVD